MPGEGWSDGTLAGGVLPGGPGFISTDQQRQAGGMHDVAIIGSGFGGSLLATLLRCYGRKVLLLERGEHPRFVIGESSTPVADLVWLDLTTRHGLKDLTSFAKWGTWQREHPEVACGLKRGFSFFHHPPGKPYAARQDRMDQLLVAASPNEEQSDTHWYRPDFDAYLVRAAGGAGVDYEDRCEVRSVVWDGSGVRLGATQRGREREFRARMVVDASAGGGPVIRALGRVPMAVPDLPPVQALYSHFRGVPKWGDLSVGAACRGAPYPVDDAAVHHVFPGGWIWVLRFGNGVVSAGVAATEPVAQRLRLEEGSRGWDRLMKEVPTVGEMWAEAEVVEPWRHLSRMSFQAGPAAGPGWALLPSAAGFVDPLLSSGFALTLLGIERLVTLLGERWGEAVWSGRDAGWEDYRTATQGERDALAGYVGALYACMGDAEAFGDIARLYFTAVIFSETARRLGREASLGGLLLRSHPGFGPAAAGLLRQAQAGVPLTRWREELNRWVADFDLGGLSDPARRPWYPVRAADLRQGRFRIGATGEEIEALLHRAGWVEAG